MLTAASPESRKRRLRGGCGECRLREGRVESVSTDRPPCLTRVRTTDGTSTRQLLPPPHPPEDASPFDHTPLQGIKAELEKEQK